MDEEPSDNILEVNGQTDSQTFKRKLVAYLSSMIILGICYVCAWATETYYECTLSFGINVLVFLAIAWPFHTEKYYDFTGMITFLSCDLFSILYHKVPWQNGKYIRNYVLFFMVILWTTRLGFFLLKRIIGEGGKDSRFDSRRNNFAVFLATWIFQGMWVYFCIMPVLIVNSIHNSDVNNGNNQTLYVNDYVGWFLWLFGWTFELISDRQKTIFKSDPTNRGMFCNVGLWSISRHPNYFGEITLWAGVAISASSIAVNAGWLIFTSPIITVVLLVFISGLPLAEKSALNKYGEVEGYQEYIKSVPVLIPFCFCWK